MNGFLPYNPNLVGTVWSSKSHGGLYMIQHCFEDNPREFNMEGSRRVSFFKPSEGVTEYVFIRSLRKPCQVQCNQWKGFKKSYERVEFEMPKKKLTPNQYLNRMNASKKYGSLGVIS